MSVGDGYSNPGRKISASRLRAARRSIARVVLMLAVAYLIGCTALYTMQDRMVYPRHVIGTPADDIPFPVTAKLYVDAGQAGRVEACFVAAPDADSKHPAPLVVFCHGNAELIDHMDDIVAGYRKLGCSVLLPEYRGYGRSAGTPSQESIGSDLASFYDQVIGRPDVDATRVVFHGRSLGAAIAVDLASRRKPDAIIGQSAFTSVVAMAHRYGAPGFLVTNPYRNDLVLPELGVPVLLFHGARDQIIAASHGRELAGLTPGAVYVEYDCGHNDFPGRGNRQAYWRQIGDFLARNNIISPPKP